MYERQFDRESAYERISDERLIEKRQEEEARVSQEREYRRTASSSNRKGSSKTALDKVLGSAATSIGRSVGTQIVRGILGAIFKR